MTESAEFEECSPATKQPGRPGRPPAAPGSRGLPGLRVALAVAGMTQRELAARLKVGAFTVSYYARLQSDPSISRLREIAAILDCPVATLIYPPTLPPAVVAGAAATA